MYCNTKPKQWGWKTSRQVKGKGQCFFQVTIESELFIHAWVSSLNFPGGFPAVGGKVSTSTVSEMTGGQLGLPGRSLLLKFVDLQILFFIQLKPTWHHTTTLTTIWQRLEVSGSLLNDRIMSRWGTGVMAGIGCKSNPIHGWDNNRTPPKPTWEQRWRGRRGETQKPQKKILLEPWQHFFTDINHTWR